MKIPSSIAVVSRVGKLSACLLLAGAMLSQTARSTPNYATEVLSNNPVAFWQLNETNNPSVGSVPAYDSTSNGHNGTYGADAQNGYNGILGPQPPTYKGFPTNQGALQCAVSDAASVVAIPALNLSTDAVSIVMWINPSGGQSTYTGLFMHRDPAGDASGFGFGGTQNGAGMAELGYTWNNNSSSTWGFNSGLYPVAGIWQLAALVVQSNSATIYLYYVDPNTGQPDLYSSVNSMAHTAEAFGSQGVTMLGSDVANGISADSTRVFGGDIADVAVYNSSLTSEQILALFAAGVGVTGFTPTITTQPRTPQYVIAGAQAQFSATGIGGGEPFTYQWTLNGTDINLLADNTNFIGATSNVLTVLSATANDVGTYRLVINNPAGTTYSTNATLALQAPALVAEWFTNGVLTDLSGYKPAGTHKGFVVGGGNYLFTNDVPYGKAGQSLFLFYGDTAIEVTNSSTADANYDDTFDSVINNSMTLAFWAKGLPSGAWSPWISKYGDNNQGWQLRAGSPGDEACWTVRDGGAGGFTLGSGSGGSLTGDLDDLHADVDLDTNDWHFYVGTFDAGTGIRNLYRDGQLEGQETNNTLYFLSPASHVCIGAQDAAGTLGTAFFTGEFYDVRVYNYEIPASMVQQLYGPVPVAISTEPGSIAPFAGRTAQIHATVSGALPITYQWQFNGTNVNLLADAANFSGVNSSVLTILSVSPNDVGTYQLIVSNAYGTATSTGAALTITPEFLVGQWCTNGSLTDVSGYSPAGAHDGYAVNASGTTTSGYGFTNDVPFGRAGQSLVLSGTTGIAINNSALGDASYTNTFDDTISNAMTVACWAKGWPASWNPFVSKYGEGPGWQLRNDGNNNVSPCWTVRGAGGSVVLGTAVYGNSEDMAATSLSYGTPPFYSGAWHHYAGTYNALTGVRDLYVDGVLVAQATGGGFYNLAQSDHLCIGAKDSSGSSFGNFFAGEIFDVRIYNYDLSSNEVQVLAYQPDPSIAGQPPQSLTTVASETVTISATVIGTAPITNQWQLNGVNLVDGSYGAATITGSKSNVLTIANVTTNLQGAYRLVASNVKGSLMSSNAILTVLPPQPPPAGIVVGQWFINGSLADVSGYSPAGTHDGYCLDTTNFAPYTGYAFTSDVPGSASGRSLLLPGGAFIVISNSANTDSNYVGTFDNTNVLTVAFWAKGAPTADTWDPWVSKNGDNGEGYQLRTGGATDNYGNPTPCWTVRDNSSGVYTLGGGPTWSEGGDQDDMHAVISGAGGALDYFGVSQAIAGPWHFYVGTFDGVSGIRNLYVDTVLQAQEIGNVPYNVAADSHVCIGGQDRAGTFDDFSSAFEIYNVCIYNAALSQANVVYLYEQVVTPAPPAPVFTGRPVLNGHQFVLTWSSGQLLQATNVTGPWVETGATSPYTNNVSTAPRMFYRLSNP